MRLHFFEHSSYNVAAFFAAAIFLLLLLVDPVFACIAFAESDIRAALFARGEERDENFSVYSFVLISPGFF